MGQKGKLKCLLSVRHWEQIRLFLSTLYLSKQGPDDSITTLHSNWSLKKLVNIFFLNTCFPLECYVSYFKVNDMMYEGRMKTAHQHLCNIIMTLYLMVTADNSWCFGAVTLSCFSSLHGSIHLQAYQMARVVHYSSQVLLTETALLLDSHFLNPLMLWQTLTQQIKNTPG